MKVAMRRTSAWVLPGMVYALWLLAGTCRKSALA